MSAWAGQINAYPPPPLVPPQYFSDRRRLATNSLALDDQLKKPRSPGQLLCVPQACTRTPKPCGRPVADQRPQGHWCYQQAQLAFLNLACVTG